MKGKVRPDAEKRKPPKREKRTLPKAYHSPLRPHFELIRELRRKRKTWKEISEILAGEPYRLKTSHKTIQNFFRRALYPKRIPMGFEDFAPAAAAPIPPRPTAPPKANPPGPAPGAPAQTFRQKLEAKKPQPKEDPFGLYDERT
jgi:hypothetical protein